MSTENILSEPEGDNTVNRELSRGSGRTDRIFLCVVDNTTECSNAIYFSARRTMRAGGSLGLLYILEPAEFQHWMSVEEKMRQEGLEEAQDFLKQYSSQVQGWTGETPILYVREGKPAVR